MVKVTFATRFCGLKLGCRIWLAGSRGMGDPWASSKGAYRNHPTVEIRRMPLPARGGPPPKRISGERSGHHRGPVPAWRAGLSALNEGINQGESADLGALQRIWAPAERAGGGRRRGA